MADLMACGHTAQGIDSTGAPVCAICVGLTPDARKVVEAKPVTAYWNIPGYLPDYEPLEFDTRDEALRYLADEILNWWGDFYVPNDQVDDAIAYLKENGWVHFNGYFYGIGE